MIFILNLIQNIFVWTSLSIIIKFSITKLCILYIKYLIKSTYFCIFNSPNETEGRYIIKYQKLAYKLKTELYNNFQGIINSFSDYEILEVSPYVILNNY